VTTLGFLNPKAGSGQSRLVFNLGWVLADAGFRVGLVDFDPQAGLTERAGASGASTGSVYGALAPLLTPAGHLQPPELVELASHLWLVRGHILASTFDDLLTMSTSLPEGRTTALVDGIGHLIASISEQAELDVVLCDLGSTLGPWCRAVATHVDSIIVPLAPRVSEDAALQGLSTALRRWREAPEHPTRSEPYQTLGCVIIRPSGVVDVALDQLATAYQRELSGKHLGTIKEFPSLVDIARSVRKPEVELTMADGAGGSLSSAARDLRRQYEVLATQVVQASYVLDEDLVVEQLERELCSALEDDLPASLDSLSTNTAIDGVGGVTIETLEIRPGGLRVVGSASVSVTLSWDGGEARDGLDTNDHFPLRFDVELDRSHESVAVVHRLEVDTSSFYE
jgi:cellulose biosynthesis protein BcsQ